MPDYKIYPVKFYNSVTLNIGRWTAIAGGWWPGGQAGLAMDPGIAL
jgi:hypothetical protein